MNIAHKFYNLMQVSLGMDINEYGPAVKDFLENAKIYHTDEYEGIKLEFIVFEDESFVVFSTKSDPLEVFTHLGEGSQIHQFEEKDEHTRAIKHYVAEKMNETMR